MAGSVVERLMAEGIAVPQAVRQLERRAAVRSGVLTVGLGRQPAEVEQRWIGRRLVWWADGVPVGRWVGLVSSRLGRRLEERPAWFAALRECCRGLADDQWLVVGRGTTPERFVLRCAELWERRAVVICADDESGGKRDSDAAWAAWLRRVRQAAADRSRAARVFVSPELTRPDGPTVAPALAETPLRDRVAVLAGDRLVVLAARRGGVIERLVDARLRDRRFDPSSVVVALGDGLVQPDLAQRWLDLGAAGWPVEPRSEPSASECEARDEQAAAPRAPIVPLPCHEPWPYLVHWTRRCDGPWPGEPETKYLDDLILGRPDADHSPLAALRRIICRRRIVASAMGVRGQSAVVSFTAVPLHELPRRRVFRPHRGRWDFEPYGIAIDRSWLGSRGARPVAYGDRSLWESLGESDRPFFQLRFSGRQRTIDWSVEREWRVVGDVDLSELPADRALVFVPTRDEAQQVARVSPWPVTIVPEDARRQ